jgi:aminopeptidase N
MKWHISGSAISSPCKWWDNLWLNEGFAEWMENKPVQALHPEWNVDQSVVADLDTTLNIDSGPTTRPIRAKAETPDEIEQMFDSIAYNKASDVLLTVENYVGEETFRKGVHNYLVAHLYGNATAEDFWNAEAAVSHKPVDRIMDGLVTQPGVPVLTFGEATSAQVPVTQHRFYLSPSIQPDPAQKWTIPVCFKASQNTQQCEVLSPDTTSLRIPPHELLFANAGGKGYYRSSYTPSEYKSLVAQVETGLTPSERIILIGEEWARLRANQSPVGDYLDLVAAVKNDPDAQVLSSAIDGLKIIYFRVASTPQERASLTAWIRATFSPEYAKLGPPSATDSDNTKQLRAKFFEVLGIFGKDPRVLAEARKTAYDYLVDPSSVDPTLRQMAVAITARNGDAALFDKLQQIYETSSNPELKVSALRALAQFQDPQLVDRALNFAVSAQVRNQDAASQLGIPLQLEDSRQQAWQFIQTHWDQVQAQLTIDTGASLVGYTATFCTVSARDNVEQFFSTHKVAASNVVLRHVIENINGCVELRTLQEPKLQSWLAAQPQS